MKSKTIILLVVNAVMLAAGIGGLVYKNRAVKTEPPVVNYQPKEGSGSVLRPPSEQAPIKNNITKSQPSYMNYDQTVAQIKQWNKEAPEMTEVGVYGKTSRGKDCYYIRINNRRNSQVAERPKVLITACIHGNEPLASSTVMWYIGSLLERYGKEEAVTQLLDTRDIYFVPVLSPDSYPNSRAVDGVDPNRDFPGPSRPNHNSSAPVKAIQDLYMKIKPNAVMSGHTWGRVYLTPYGDKTQNCPDHDKIMVVMNKMKSLSGYRCIRACDMYGPNGSLDNPPIRTMGMVEEVMMPIYGSEVDWYYRNGSFAIVCEFGTHQRIPTDEDTKVEFNKTFQAFLVFVREAPLVAVNPK
jgi:hypothetical protein